MCHTSHDATEYRKLFVYSLLWPRITFLEVGTICAFDHRNTVSCLMHGSVSFAFKMASLHSFKHGPSMRQFFMICIDNQKKKKEEAFRERRHLRVCYHESN